MVDKDGHAATVWHAGREGKLEIRSRLLGRLDVVRVGHDRSHDKTYSNFPVAMNPTLFYPSPNEALDEDNQYIYLNSHLPTSSIHNWTRGPQGTAFEVFQW